MVTIEGMIPIQTVRMEVATDDPREAVRKFLKAYPMARLEMYNGSFVRGLTVCGLPVLEGDHGYKFDGDLNRYFCPDCTECKKAETGDKTP